MNATQDASNDMQNDINKKLISFNESQNDLIFKTRDLHYDNRIGGVTWLMAKSLKLLTMQKSIVSL